MIYEENEIRYMPSKMIIDDIESLKEENEQAR